MTVLSTLHGVSTTTVYQLMVMYKTRYSEIAAIFQCAHTYYTHGISDLTNTSLTNSLVDDIRIESK